jgi:SAM-dependent methyltransferase
VKTQVYAIYEINFIMMMHDNPENKPKRFSDIALLHGEAFCELSENGWLNGLHARYGDLIERYALCNVDHLKKPADWFYYVYYCQIAKKILSDPNARVIDWGGMYGQVTRILLELGHQNIFNYMVFKTDWYDEVQTELDLPTIWGIDPTRMNLDSRSVDLLISSGVLEHVSDDGQAEIDLILKDILRVLRPGGLFLIWNLPNQYSSSELLARLFNKWHHETCFSSSQIRKLLLRAGFDLVWQDKHKFLPGSVLGRLFNWINPVKLARADHLASHIWPLSIFARDHLLLAQKPDSID